MKSFNWISKHTQQPTREKALISAYRIFNYFMHTHIHHVTWVIFTSRANWLEAFDIVDDYLKVETTLILKSVWLDWECAWPMTTFGWELNEI